MATKNKPEAITASDVEQALRCKYGSSDWACLFNVANGTGSNSDRRCDAIAMSLWPSKGLNLHGHEIKVARSDWLREIQDVTKAEAFARHCHYWWIVAPKGIVKLEELPAKWGLMHISLNGKGSGIRVAKPADRRESPELNFAFLAALLRASLQQSDVERRIKDAHRAGWSEGQKLATSQQDSDFKRRHKQYENLQNAVDAFAKTSGIRIDEHMWDGGEIGEAVRLIRRGLPRNVLSKIECAERNLIRAAEQLTETRKAISSLSHEEPTV